MFVAALREALVDVAHELRLGGAEHDLQVGGLEADVLVAVDDVRRTRDAVPLAQHRLHVTAGTVLEEHLHLALEDEEDFFDLVRVGGVALTRRHEHDAEREVLRGDEVGPVVLAGAARADEAMLRATEAVHARVRERVPIRLAVDESGDLTSQESVECAHAVSPTPGGSTRTGSPT